MKHEVESDNLIVNQLTFIMSLYKIVQQFEFLTFPATFMKNKRYNAINATFLEKLLVKVAATSTISF